MCLSIQSTSIITVNGFKDTTTWKPSTCQMQTDTNSGLDKIGPSSHINLHIVTSTVPAYPLKRLLSGRIYSACTMDTTQLVILIFIYLFVYTEGGKSVCHFLHFVCFIFIFTVVLPMRIVPCLQCSFLSEAFMTYMYM